MQAIWQKKERYGFENPSGFSKQNPCVEGQKEEKVGLMEARGLEGEQQTKRKG